MKETRFRLRDIKFFFRFAGSAGWIGLIAILLGIVTTMLASLLPLSTKILIDFVIMKKGFVRLKEILSSLSLEQYYPAVKTQLESLTFLLTAIVVLALVTGTMGILQRYLSVRFQQHLTYNLQLSLFEHVLRFPLSFFRKTPSGYLTSRVSDDVDALQHLFLDNMVQILTKLVYLCSGFVILFSLSPRLTLLLITVLPLYFIISYIFGARIRSASWQEREFRAETSQSLQEAFSAVELVKSSVTEKGEVKRLSGKLKDLLRKRMQLMLLGQSSQYLSRAVQIFLTVLIIWAGAHEIMKGAITIGDFVAFSTYILYLTQSATALSYTHIMLQPSLASMDRLKELFMYLPEVTDKKLYMPSVLRGEILFKDLYFSYDGKVDVLKGINCLIRPGETIVLAGPSGAGKTTFVNLVLRFYLPSRGDIFIDGHNIRDLDPYWLRKHIGLVSQEVFLFNDTIYNNIRYGRMDADEREVIEAARLAGIDEDIKMFPRGYNTLVGERGLSLSSGQRQRISMARTFLRNPPVLIFDEPTSALDEKNERRLKESMRRLFLGRTVIVISHRPSLLEIADRVFQLQDGLLKEVSRV